VRVGRERIQSPLVAKSNFPPTSYNLALDEDIMRPLTSSGPGGRPREEESPRYEWQITLNKLQGSDGEVTQDAHATNRDEMTHRIPRFGASEMRGNVVQIPVTNWNLADEYRTNTARGFKFVRGSQPASPGSSVSTFRAQSSGTNGNSRIGNFKRGEPMQMPETSKIDFQTRNLTEVHVFCCALLSSASSMPTNY
jgi:hypothetical protein